MAYMPLDKNRMYLDRNKMAKIYDLSQPWGVDTPLWPFPGPRQDLVFPRGQYLGRFHKRTMTYTGTLHAGTHMDAPNHVLHEEEVDRERNGYSLNEIPLEYCIGTGVILDMRYLKDEFEAKWKTGFEDGLGSSSNRAFRESRKEGWPEIRPNDWLSWTPLPPLLEKEQRQVLKLLSRHGPEVPTGSYTREDQGHFRHMGRNRRAAVASSPQGADALARHGVPQGDRQGPDGRIPRLRALPQTVYAGRLLHRRKRRRRH
jgi:hypothetical protein